MDEGPLRKLEKEAPILISVFKTELILDAGRHRVLPSLSYPEE